MSESRSNVKSVLSATEEKDPWPICLTGAKSKHHQPLSSCLGPLIRISNVGQNHMFALLYCAHTERELRDRKFSFTRLYKVDNLVAKKYYTFSETDFNDLAIAHVILPEQFCVSNLIKTSLKPITLANIGQEVKIISVNYAYKNIKTTIKSIPYHSNDKSQNPSFNNLIQLDLKGVPGDSGAPVLSSENEIIGLVVRSDEQGYTYCNTLIDAKNLLLNLYAKSKCQPELNEIYLIRK